MEEKPSQTTIAGARHHLLATHSGTHLAQCDTNLTSCRIAMTLAVGALQTWVCWVCWASAGHGGREGEHARAHGGARGEHFPVEDVAVAAAVVAAAADGGSDGGEREGEG